MSEGRQHRVPGADIGARTRNSAIIWRAIVEFEIRTGQLQRAKNLLYRAVGECPLAKGGEASLTLVTSVLIQDAGLYLLAFGPLRDVFTARELEGFVDIMAERGLRVRRGLEEYGWKGGEREENGYIGEGDEIEQAADERRRLMPY